HAANDHGGQGDGDHEHAHAARGVAGDQAGHDADITQGNQNEDGSGDGENIGHTDALFPKEISKENKNALLNMEGGIQWELSRAVQCNMVAQALLTAASKGAQHYAQKALNEVFLPEYSEVVRRPSGHRIVLARHRPWRTGRPGGAVGLWKVYLIAHGRRP